VPGFADIKDAALSAGALGCSLSGSGPSMFALCRGADQAQRVAAAMTGAVTFAIGAAPQTYVSPIVAEGARVVRAS
jgi:homoserine kinase